MKRILILLSALSLTYAITGCGPSAPEHEIKPLENCPVEPNNFQSLKTPEEKIKFIEESMAPESEKKKAIEQIKAGKL